MVTQSSPYYIISYHCLTRKERRRQSNPQKLYIGSSQSSDLLCDLS